MEYVKLKPDMSGSEGDATVMFRAADATWRTDAVTDGPFLFRTRTGRLGSLWTSWRSGRYVQGVAYSETGSIKGPWKQVPLPITPDNYGHGMLFRTFDGQLLMSVHSHRNINIDKQIFERHPCLFIMDDSGDELKTVMEYNPYVSLQAPSAVMVDNPGFDYGKNGWTSTTGAQNQKIATNQSGAITGNFFESWDAGSFVGDMYQEKAVPNGTYRLTAAAFRNGPITGSDERTAAVYLFANDEQTEVTTSSPAIYSVTVVVKDGKLRFGLRSSAKAFKWMGLDNVSLKYYGEDTYTAEQISMAEANDDRIYLRNKQNGRFLSGGSSWGTKAVLSRHAMDFRLVDLHNGKYALDSRLDNGNGNHYAAANGYLDGKMAQFTLGWVGDSVCTLTIDGTHYWASNGPDNVNTQSTAPTRPMAQWELKTFGQLVSELDGATADSPADATFLVGCPNFGRNDTRISQWEGTLTVGGDATNQCAQAPTSAFTIKQTLTDIPNGTYELKAQGFYRDGTQTLAEARHEKGTERLAAKLFANNETTALPSIFSEGLQKVPTSLDDCSAAFSAGRYQTSLKVKVTDNRLSIGVKKSTGNTPADNWTVFDNIELYYLGDGTSTGIRTDVVTKRNRGVYDLMGRKVDEKDLRGHGVYIVNGKKIAR